jgi:hypothetical protein
MGKVSRSDLEERYSALIRETICKYDYMECLVLLETKVDVSPKVWMKYSLEQLQQLLIRLWGMVVPGMMVPTHLAAAYLGETGGAGSYHCALAALQYRAEQPQTCPKTMADCEELAREFLWRVNNGMQNGIGMSPNLPPKPLIQFRRKGRTGPRMPWTREEVRARWETDEQAADEFDASGEKMVDALDRIQDRIDKAKRGIEARRSKKAVHASIKGRRAAQERLDEENGTDSSSSDTDYSSDSNSEMDGMALPQPVNKRVTSIPQLKRKAMAREDPEDQRVFRMEENGRRYKQPRL